MSACNTCFTRSNPALIPNTLTPEKPKTNRPTKEKSPAPTREFFRIVCIGASAGGLEALEQFLSNVNEKSDMAYVVIQHLDPTQTGMLPELLQRISPIPVLLAKDHMAMSRNCVYVIPPNKSMSVLKRKLYLFEPLESRGMRLPIDFFLNSLADDVTGNAVGVILSGMGSDGTVGLQSIKAKGGIVMVQAPETAKFDSMPRSAIGAVVADIVAPANELPERLSELIQHVPPSQSKFEISSKEKSALEKVIILLRTYTGNDFSHYKKNTLHRRIERRMIVHKITKIIPYVHFLQENPKEGDILFKELLIGVTNFFRDPPVWIQLRDSVLPELIKDRKNESTFRIWVAGCSTGEEAYSLAIVFQEAVEKLYSNKHFDLSIFASDLDNDAIEKARKGVFPEGIEADVSPERLKRFFTKTMEGYRVNSDIRESVVFAHHNVALHPPFTKIDLISCRNLLIYLDAELQRKIIGLFHFSLSPGGIMVLGSSETLGQQSTLFTTLSAKTKIYRRSEASMTVDLLDFPTSFSMPSQANSKPHQAAANVQTLADQLLLQKFSPVGVLVTENGDIIYTSGRTGKYLEPAVGKANLNIFAMLREGLRSEFPVIFRKAITKKTSEVVHNLKVGTAEALQTVELTVAWIDAPGLIKGTVMVVFKDVPNEAGPAQTRKISYSRGARQKAMEEELRKSKEETQGMLEDMQTSQEELKSTNEELQSTNEELQSTNEELTSSKEEMQSLNEELQTVNAELQSKVDDYLRVNNDMKNLLNSTDIATLFLDKQLNIRRFTQPATKIFKLINTDIGRPFTDQVSDLIYPELAEDAAEVLSTLVPIEKQIPTKNHRWFTTRTMPYRTFDDRIDGLVITFVNITDIKLLEAGQQTTEAMHKLFVSGSSDVFLQLSVELDILEFNPQAEALFGLKRAKVLGQGFVDTLAADAEKKKIGKQLKALLKGDKIASFEATLMTADNTLSAVDCKVQVVMNSLKQPETLIMIINKNHAL